MTISRGKPPASGTWKFIYIIAIVLVISLLISFQVLSVKSYQISSTNCACNLEGSISSECDQISGQCKCKNPNIVGLKCDKCRENYHNLTSGCIECDICYQIVQLGVEYHRRELADLKDLIEKLEKNPENINDEKLHAELLKLAAKVNALLRQAETDQGIESTLLGQLESLLSRLAKIKDTTGTIEGYLNSTKPLLIEATANVTLAEKVLRQIQDEAMRAERHLKNEGMFALNKARERANRLGKQSQKMTDMAKESKQLADQHELDANKLADLTTAAMNHTTIAHELAKNASLAQELNAKNIAQLRQQIENLVDKLGKTGKSAKEATADAKRAYDEALALYTLINSLQIKRADIPRLKQEAEEHLRNAQRLRLEVEEFIKRHAQLIDSTQFKLNEMKALLAEAMRQQIITDGQLADLDNSIKKAKEAVKQGDRTLKEAQDTLATLKKFDQRVQESQKEAMEALKKIPAIRKMIKHAEDKTRDAAAKLDTALADATDARDIARQAFNLANETTVDVKKMRLEADELKLKIKTLKTQTGELANNVNHTANAMDNYESIAKRDGDMAMTILEKISTLSNSAKNATNRAKALLDVLNPLLKSLDKFDGIDSNKLAQLENELDKLRNQLLESNLTAITDDLLMQRNKQRELMAGYQSLIDWLVKEVANVKAIRDSLPDKCFKRTRLEIPKQEN